jgi:hypothetical protein
MIIIFLDETRVESITQYNVLNWIFETRNLLFPKLFLESYEHEGQEYFLPKMMTADYYSRLEEDIRYLVDLLCPFKEMELL